MLIDWFTVVAQALNFLILVWLMRRYLYRPILNAIDAREKLVAKQLSEAESKMVDANAERDDFHRKNAEFDSQRTEMLDKAGVDAKAESEKILAEARAAADALRAQQADSQKQAYKSLCDAVKRRACSEVIDISRKALADLATVTLEDSMVATLDRKLRALNDKDRSELKLEFESEGSAPVVRSAFELAEEQRDGVRSLLKEVLGVEAPIQFATTSELLSGIELSAHGRKIGWSIDGYLHSLDEKVGEILNVG